MYFMCAFVHVCVHELRGLLGQGERLWGFTLSEEGSHWKVLGLTEKNDFF